ncbi:MAG TPA: cysteine-rich CWC family protein [Caballeronia sp.]|nr:cysteine-rich CWC family protein [Caballeronia sp.]
MRLVTVCFVFRRLAPLMSSTDPAPQRCALCGAFFRCAQQTGDAQCWCAALPALPAGRLNPDMTCLCPDCLREETQRSINR